MISRRIYGTLYGNCIGDAIGLLSEFMTKDEAKQYYGKFDDLEYEQKVPDFHRSRWKNGDWTDDSDQMILMMQSLTEKNGKVDAPDYGNKVLHWARHGFKELGDFAGMGLGATTHHVLKHPSYKTDPHFAAEDIWEKSGRFAAPNGAVMRTSAMGIYHYKDIDKVIHNTLQFCKVTHADPRCQASCVAVTTAIAMMLQGKHFDESKNAFDIVKLIDESYQYGKKMIPEGTENWKEYRSELKKHMHVTKVKELKLDENGKIGYTYKTLGAGFWALRQDDFRQALQKIVMAAGDADTNGAVAGALLGCKLGREGLPPTWYNGLVHKKWLDNIIEKFLALPGFDGSSDAGDAPNKDTPPVQKQTQAAQGDGQESSEKSGAPTDTQTKNGEEKLAADAINSASNASNEKVQEEVENPTNADEIAPSKSEETPNSNTPTATAGNKETKID